MNKVRWGILSTSNFAQAKVIPALLKCERVEVAAVASRDQARAYEVAGRFGIPKAYGSYEELLADPEIDVVYNPAPNHLHVPWSIKALEAGKHVLCEKPIGLSAAEARQLLDASKKYSKVKVMEAFMYRHHPQWGRAKRIVGEGGIGALRTIHSFFSYFNDDPDNIRNKPEIGGGGLMDIGCYNISLSRFIFGEEPRRVLGVLDYDPNFKTDRVASGVLDFGNGTATFTCSTQLAPHQMICHLGDSFKFTFGEKEISSVSNPITRTVVKWIALYAPTPWPRGVKTRPEVDQEIGGTPPDDFERDRRRLVALIERFTAAAKDAEFRPHPFFGDMSEDQWMRWGYLHCDHHLKQFGT